MSNSIDNMTSRQRIGRIGEDAVALRYAEMGFSVVARNLHISRNEIDLILQNETYLVFVEVKTRHATPGVPSRYGRPAAAIDNNKRMRMRKVAVDYLREHPTPLQPRIDVAEVYMHKGTNGIETVREIKIFPAAYAGR
ncbi:MAG: YraN family protein [Clostridia bacterium]|nr:YraN family protein [Clostridia bacterium]